MSLHQIIYTSHSPLLMSRNELVALLDQSRRANVAAGITGLLLHADGSFMQAIEGEASAIHQLFERIKLDSRHSGIILICDEPIAQRSYADWSMAFREISPAEMVQLPGFCMKEQSISERDRDVARNVMYTFFKNAGLSKRA
jgi:hypothetical protein